MSVSQTERWKMRSCHPRRINARCDSQHCAPNSTPAIGKLALKHASVHPSTEKLPGTLAPKERTRSSTESLYAVVIRYCNIPEETDTLEATQGLP